jgi:hypothetical protein
MQYTLAWDEFLISQVCQSNIQQAEDSNISKQQQTCITLKGLVH